MTSTQSSPALKSKPAGVSSPGSGSFVAAAGLASVLPPMRGIEIAFAGRSNVGKSIAHQRAHRAQELARASTARPAARRSSSSYRVGDRLRVVDMPGYGYAAAAKSKIGRWTALIEPICAAAATSPRVIRAGGCAPRPQDRPMTRRSDALGQVGRQPSGRPDQRRRSSSHRSWAAASREVQAALAKRPGRFPDGARDVIPRRNRDPELRAAIARLLAEEAADALSDSRYIG